MNVLVDKGTETVSKESHKCGMTSRKLVKANSRDRVLTSNGQFYLKVPRSSHIFYGDRSCYVAGPKGWNKLPLALKALPTVDSFKLNLKTYLFNQCYC